MASGLIYALQVGYHLLRGVDLACLTGGFGQTCQFEFSPTNMYNVYRKRPLPMNVPLAGKAMASVAGDMRSGDRLHQVNGPPPTTERQGGATGPAGDPAAGLPSDAAGLDMASGESAMPAFGPETGSPSHRALHTRPACGRPFVDMAGQTEPGFHPTGAFGARGASAFRDRPGNRSRRPGHPCPQAASKPATERLEIMTCGTDRQGEFRH